MKPRAITSRSAALALLALVTAPSPRAAASDGRNAVVWKGAAPSGETAPAVRPSAVRVGSCSPLDLVFVIDDTGSMGPAIDSVRSGLATIVETAEQASGGDLRLGLLTFKDDVTVLHALTADVDAVRSSINGIFAAGGGESPEASDEAKNTVVNNLPAGVRADSAGHPGTQNGDFTVAYRPEAEKIVVLVTDAPPGGFDDVSETADRLAMHQHAVAAKAKGIVIADVFVPTEGDYDGQQALLEDDATTSGGAFITVSSNGSGTAEAISAIIEQCGRAPSEDAASSPTQPAAELVMPFDSTDGKASFLVVSNLNGTSPHAAQVSTHWVFWSETCDELADVAICLTLNDTIVVDPRHVRAVGRDNEERGPVVDLDGKRGLVTVTAYETDEACADFRLSGGVLRDDAIVGAYTFADQAAGYSFGRDAEGFGTDNPSNPKRVVLPRIAAGDRFALQVFDPGSTEASVAVLAHLRGFESGPVEPVNDPLTFSTTFTDNLEVSVSLPDVSVGCVKFVPLAPGLIPDTISTNSSGLFTLRALDDGAEDDALFALVGQAVGRYGAVSSLKTVPE